MTKFSLTLVVIITHFSFAQSSGVMFIRANFDAWKSENSGHLYDQYTELFKASAFYKENREFYEENYLESHFIIADFDQDGLNDIIYEGLLNGGESEYVVFLHRTLYGFSRVLNVAGYPIHVSSPKASYNFQFSIKHYGCCEDVVSNVEHYSLVTIENQVRFTLTSKYSFIDLETSIFPTEFLDSPIQFETINSEYSLRFTPEIDDSTEFTRHHIGNKTAAYPKGSIGVALAEKTDASGRVWWFVYMKNNLALLENHLHGGFNNDAPYFSYGWMSSRFVSIIE